MLDRFRAPDDGIWAIYPHNRHLSPKVRLLLDHLGEGLNSQTSQASTKASMQTRPKQENQ